MLERRYEVVGSVHEEGGRGRLCGHIERKPSFVVDEVVLKVYELERRATWQGVCDGKSTYVRDNAVAHVDVGETG